MIQGSSPGAWKREAAASAELGVLGRAPAAGLEVIPEDVAWSPGWGRVGPEEGQTE